MWKEDAPFSTDPVKLPNEASKCSGDIQKYCDIKTVEQRKLREMSIYADNFRFKLMRFYRDGVATLDKETAATAKEREWEIPPGGKPSVKTDVKSWVDSNPDMINIILDLGEQNDILELVEAAIKALHAKAILISSTMKQVQHNNGSGY